MNVRFANLYLCVTVLALALTPFCIALAQPGAAGPLLSLSSEKHKKHKWNNARYNYFLKDAAGNVVASFEDYKFMEAFEVSRFFITGCGQPASYGRSKNVGLVDAATGQVAVPCTATSIERIGSCIIYASFSGGGATLLKVGVPGSATTYEAVKISRPQHKGEWQAIAVKTGGKWGYLDTCGNVLVPPRYDEADLLSNGSARVRLGDKWTLLDGKLREIGPPRFGYIGYSLGNFYPYSATAVADVYGKPQGGKLGLLNTRGEVLAPEIYDEFMMTGDKLTAKKDGQWVTLNAQSLGNGGALSATAALPQVVKEFHKQTKWGYYKYGYTLGNDVVVKPKYDMAYPFQGSHAVVGNEGKNKIITFGGNEAKATEYGLVNLQGREVIPTRYKALWPYTEKLYGFATGGDYESSWLFGIMDTTGDVLVPATFKRLGELREGLIAAKTATQVGYVDITGKAVIPYRYVYGTSFVNGVACVADADNQWYWIDKQGKELMPGRRFVSVTDWDSTGRAWTWNTLDKWNRPDSALLITRTGKVVGSRPRNGPPPPALAHTTRCSKCHGSGFAYKSRDVAGSFTWTEGMFKPVETRTTYGYSYKVYEKDGACTRCGGDGYE